MPVLRSADRYYRLSAGIARKAVLDARDAHRRGLGPVAQVLQAHQRAEVDLARLAVGAMLDEQSITATATALLDSSAFTTMVEDLERMLDKVATDAAFDRLIGSLTQGAGRDAMSLEVAVRPDLVWVRHVNPPCCSRCAILAGRVYRWSDGFERHPGCDCVNIPTTVSAGSGLTMSPEDLVTQGLVTGLSKADLLVLAEGGDLNQIVNIRKQAAGLSDGREILVRRGRLTPAGILNEAEGDRGRVAELIEVNGYGRTASASARTTPPAASGSGSSGTPPRPPAPPANAPGGPGEPDPADRDATRAYWQARQDALGIDTNGETLTPDEVRFAERFHGRHGTIAQWFKADRTHRRKTNDFEWAELAIEAELKSPKDRYRTIANAIRADTPWKQHFIVDLGHKALTQALRWQLEKYNERNPDHTITALWVLSQNGAEFDEINLKSPLK
ncbi:hypothetical protein F9L07_22665 [Pimelobacter simplex]|uniref:Phage protein n=1 Tax=Nocardioides simplex TaxID=2045 RepID=A0A7J5DTC4_NOCSI|nr:hypothetical protein [Pimelobacter simplex]KAB2808321.1 hypothetical protein F9L07_22665 [Pimelobacter simplex]